MKTVAPMPTQMGRPGFPREVALAAVLNDPTLFVLKEMIMIAGVRACWCRFFGILGVLLGVLVLASSAKPQAKPEQAKPEAKNTSTIDFNRQILPLLSENCFACHGPD